MKQTSDNVPSKWHVTLWWDASVCQIRQVGGAVGWGGGKGGGLSVVGSSEAFFPVLGMYKLIVGGLYWGSLIIWFEWRDESCTAVRVCCAARSHHLQMWGYLQCFVVVLSLFFYCDETKWFVLMTCSHFCLPPPPLLCSCPNSKEKSVRLSQDIKFKTSSLKNKNLLHSEVRPLPHYSCCVSMLASLMKNEYTVKKESTFL